MEARPEPGQEIGDRVRTRAAGDGAADHRLDVLRGVIGAPGEAIGLLPFLARHARMVGRHMFEVELIEVGVDVDALGHRLGVILAAGQRRQDREFKNVERQFALDDLDALDERFLRVVREADDVAAIGDAPVLAPLEQELAIVGDVVLLLLRRRQIVGIDVLKPDEHPLDARRHRLLDEAGNLVAGRVDLDDEARVDALLAQFDQPVEDRFPVAIAGEIVVGDEEVADAVGDIDRAPALRCRRPSDSATCGPAR